MRGSSVVCVRRERHGAERSGAELSSEAAQVELKGHAPTDRRVPTTREGADESLPPFQPSVPCPKWNTCAVVVLCVSSDCERRLARPKSDAAT
jgi:hypothetical protein